VAHHRNFTDTDPIRAKEIRARMSTTKAQILVVDDVPDAADALGLLLESEGYSVAVVHSGSKALQVAQADSPVVAVVDIGMPIIDGYEVARRIRDSSWGGTTQLIALTGWNDAEHRHLAKRAGFHHYIIKPVASGPFLELIGRLVLNPRMDS
jgi:two-component system, chemotaxis family, CheB/CheR fusion protein